MIFHTKYPNNFAPPSAIEKNMIFWRKIVIFHTKYPKYFRPTLRHWKKIWFFGVKSRFFTRNTPKICAPPSLTWNPGTAPVLFLYFFVFVYIYDLILFPLCRKNCNKIMNKRWKIFEIKIIIIIKTYGKWYIILYKYWLLCKINNTIL